MRIQRPKKDLTLPMPRVSLTPMLRPACFQYAAAAHPTRRRREARYVAKIKGSLFTAIPLCSQCKTIAAEKGTLVAYRPITDAERDAHVHRPPTAVPPAKAEATP